MSDEQVKDPLAVGLGSLAGGAGFGAVPMTLCQIWVALNQERYVLNGYLLPASLFLAIGIAGMCGWYRTYRLENVWQQGVIAVLAAIGAILIGFLAAPINTFVGPVGMIIWLLVNIAVGVIATRWAIRGIELPSPGTGA